MRSGAARPPSGDDLMFLYTGGTTGMPKGVMWRNDDLYVALWQMGRPGTEPPDAAAAVAAGKRAGTALPACPLMHGTGLFITLSTLAGGGTVVLIDKVGLDARADLERDRAQRGAGAHHRRRRVRPATARRARRRADPLGPLGPARDHVEWRHLEPRGEARAARPPAGRHPARLARRVRRAHEPIGVEVGRREDRGRPLRSERPGQGRHQGRQRGRAGARTRSGWWPSAAGSPSATTRTR